MKTLITFLISSLFVAPLFAQYRQAQSAQNVIITFDGNGNRYGQTYQVVIDGRSYTSDKSDNGRWNNTRTSSAAGTAVTFQLQTGQHSLQVYNENNNNRYGNQTRSNMPVYSSTFILRQGYDATIQVRNNGRVQIAETPAGYNNGRNRRNRDGDGDDDEKRNG
ncbi:MAG: hypothetical protein ABJA57_04080, partial [Ginsengibacter sp.]